MPPIQPVRPQEPEYSKTWLGTPKDTLVLGVAPGVGYEYTGRPSVLGNDQGHSARFELDAFFAWTTVIKGMNKTRGYVEETLGEIPIAVNIGATYSDSASVHAGVRWLPRVHIAGSLGIGTELYTRVENIANGESFTPNAGIRLILGLLTAIPPVGPFVMLDGFADIGFDGTVRGGVMLKVPLGGKP